MKSCQVELLGLLAVLFESLPFYSMPQLFPVCSLDLVTDEIIDDIICVKRAVAVPEGLEAW